MTGAPKLTDTEALALHRQRATRGPVLFLHEIAAAEIKERLVEVNKSFTAPLLVGFATDPVRGVLPNAPVIEDAQRLSAEPATHDLVLHSFALHWSDDPIGQMVQSRLALQPDGLFLAVMFGGATLNELRTALAEAEAELTGGLSPRVLPMADLRDLGGLLSRAGLALPVADSSKLTVRYPSLARLVGDLRGMAETNALLARHRATPPRRLFERTEEIYRSHFADDDGYLTATFELVFLTGWAPSETQQKPLRPGAAQHRLASALGVEERPAGDPVAPRSR
jgi:hypothetical protein